MKSHNAYINDIPGNREPTMEEARLLSYIIAGLVKHTGVEHTTKFLGTIFQMVNYAMKDGNMSLHFDCFDRADENGKMRGFCYVGTDAMDAMVASEAAHFVDLHTKHAEAVREHEAKRPREN